jgi:hypothetical protein
VQFNSVQHLDPGGCRIHHPEHYRGARDHPTAIIMANVIRCPASLRPAADRIQQQKRPYDPNTDNSGALERTPQCPADLQRFSGGVNAQIDQEAAVTSVTAERWVRLRFFPRFVC